MIKSSCLVKGQCKIILMVKSQSKYLAGQHFDRGQRSEYRIYQSATPLYCYITVWIPMRLKTIQFLAFCQQLATLCYYVDASIQINVLTPAPTCFSSIQRKLIQSCHENILNISLQLALILWNPMNK